MARVTRTCVVCRKTDEKDNLLRFVLRGHLGPAACSAGLTLPGGGEAEIVVDYLGTYAGRGVYCHATENCLLDNLGAAAIAGRLVRIENRRQWHKFVSSLGGACFFAGLMFEAMNNAIADIEGKTINKRTMREKQRLVLLKELQGKFLTVKNGVSRHGLKQGDAKEKRLGLIRL